METIGIRYCFILEDESEEIFDLMLDAQHLELINNTPEVLPPWTNLDFHQCPICPLTVDSRADCPLAANICGIVRRFDRLVSYDKVHVKVLTEERSVSQDTTVQIGISSLIGLVMAASGCPHTAFFRPMARFHLPLASPEETIYRVTSMYLLAQYFSKTQGQNADLELRGLKDIYDNIHIINTSVAERLRAATEADSTLNAVVMLDMYAIALPHVIEDSLEDIRHLFEPFMRTAG